MLKPTKQKKLRAKMQIALRHLRECFYMQSSEMMLAYKILTNIQTQVKLKTTLILFFC